MASPLPFDSPFASPPLRASKPPPIDADNDEDDPIVATYSVFIKPPLPSHRKLVVLQYVNKTAQETAHIRPPKVAELRIKPKTGMYEVDVPLDTLTAYDRPKGVAWGTALQKSMETKKGGSLGLAGGFGIGAPVVRNPGGRRGGGGGNNEDSGPLSWVEATRQDKVLRTQTLGGGRSAEEENARNMVGVFQGNNIHLTPVSSLVHLRPVQHYIDAAAEQERLARPTLGGAAAAAAADKAAGRAIHMTLKAAMDEDGVSTETMADRLRAVQTESWRRMEWIDDESESAWAAYNESLLLRTTTTTAADPSGKGKAKEEDVVYDDSGAPDLVDRVPRLQTDWGEEDLLRAVAGIKKGDKKPGEEAISPTNLLKMQGGDAKGKGKARAVKTEIKTEKKEPAGRVAKAPAATAPKRATRAKPVARGGGAGASNTIQLD